MKLLFLTLWLSAQARSPAVEPVRGISLAQPEASPRQDPGFNWTQSRQQNNLPTPKWPFLLAGLGAVGFFFWRRKKPAPLAKTYDLELERLKRQRTSGRKNRKAS